LGGLVSERGATSPLGIGKIWLYGFARTELTNSAPDKAAIKIIMETFKTTILFLKSTSL